jgi:hypothetical protein
LAVCSKWLEYSVNILNYSGFFAGSCIEELPRAGKETRRQFIRFFEISLNIYRLAVYSKWPEYLVNILNYSSFFCGKLRRRSTARE